jgi:hypothetical protein
MTGTHFTLVGLLTAALAAPAVCQEGGFQPPVNTEPVIPIPTGQAQQSGYYTSAEFFVGRRGELVGARTLYPDVAHLTAGGFGALCARGLPRPAGPILPAQQLYRQLVTLGEPFRPAVEEWSAKNILLGSPN